MLKFIFLTIITLTTNALNINHISPINPINMISSNHICPTYLQHYTKHFNEHQGEFIIKTISSTFPQVDSISHIVLHTSDNLINFTLNNNILSNEMKKFIVLFIVEGIQSGDATGGYILDFYHQLVNCLL